MTPQNEDSSAPLLSSMLCFVFLELHSKYSCTTLYSLTPKKSKGGIARLARGVGACPNGIRGSLKHEAEEVILTAGQFEDNQRELSSRSFHPDSGNATTVHVSGTKHAATLLSMGGGNERRGGGQAHKIKAEGGGEQCRIG
ncbi:unnamed protein product [Pleuronectes platessa]|uniref:Uncharacterized protein n=1 Tax=Pleuronectes platessa TaxID=8262 RepID=A0A9N7YRR1_PLEPL|nr:unnamed protein product [Pleuronectes platessa]